MLTVQYLRTSGDDVLSHCFVIKGLKIANKIHNFAAIFTFTAAIFLSDSGSHFPNVESVSLEKRSSYMQVYIYLH